MDNQSREELAELIDGRTVAIVGNAHFLRPKGVGAQIDASDTVLRMNHCEGVFTEECGSKTTAVVIAPSSEWQRRVRAGRESIRAVLQAKPKIFLTSVLWARKPQACKHINFYGDSNYALSDIRLLPDSGRITQPSTTGTRLVCAIADLVASGRAKPKSILVAHFTFGGEWIGYISTEGRHYIAHRDYRPIDEEVIRVNAIQDCGATIIH